MKNLTAYLFVPIVWAFYLSAHAATGSAQTGDVTVNTRDPAVTSPTATNLTWTGATLGGNVTDNGGATITERGVVYSVTATNDNPLIGGNGAVKAATPGTTEVFTVPVTGLNPGTVYSYKAYAIYSQGTSYTDVGTFVTLFIDSPTVTSPTAINLTWTGGATLGGNATDDGGATIIERGVVYSVTGTNNNPLIGGNGAVKAVTPGTTGVFTVPVTGLNPGTVYSYKAYAINSLGISYTGAGTFVTLFNDSFNRFYWDSDATDAGNLVDGTNLGGTGTWDASLTNWWNPLTADEAWPNTATDRAIFTGTFSAIPTASALTVGAGGVIANQLRFSRSGYTLSGGTITLAGVAPSLYAEMGETATVQNILGGTAGLTKLGGGSVRLTGVNTYTGTTNISGGSLIITSGAALGADTSAVNVTAGNGTPSNTQVGFTGGSLLLDGTSAGFTLSRNLNLEGRGPIGNSGAALLSLGSNTVSGTVNTQSSAQTPATFRATRLTAVDGTLTLSGTVNVPGVVATNITTLGGVNQAGVGNYNLTGPLTGSGTLEKSGGGTLFFNPSSFAGFTGSLRIGSSVTTNQSTVRIATPLVLGTNTGTGASSVIDLNGSGTLEVRMNAPTLQTLSGTATVDASVYSRSTTNSNFFVGHALGSSTVNGNLTLGQFGFAAGAATTFTSRDGYGINFTTALVVIGNGNLTITNNLSGTLSFTGDFWSNSNTDFARTVTVTGSGNTTINGDFVASGGAAVDHVLTKTGSGILTITGTASTLDGAVNVQGALRITDFRSIGGTANTSTITLGSASTTSGALIFGTQFAASATGLTSSRAIVLNGTTISNSIYANQTVAFPVTLNGTITRPAATTGGVILGGTSTQDNIITTAIPVSGTSTGGGLTKLGSGTWVLSGANAYAGPTTIQDGTLKLRATAGTSDSIPSAATNTVVFSADAVTQSAAGTLQYTGFLDTATTEELGVLTPTAGAAKVIATANGTGTTAITFTGLGTRGAGATIDYQPGINATISLSGTSARVTNGILGAASVSAFQTFKGVDWATISGISGGPVLQFVGYTTALPISGSAGAAINYAISASSTTTGSTSINTLKLIGINGTAGPANTLTLGGLLTLTARAMLFDNSGGAGAITGSQFGASATEVHIITNGTSPTNALTINSVIGGSTGSLTKSGSGLLIVGGNNTFTGNTIINEGTVRMSGATATLGLTGTGANTITVRQGAILDINAAGVAQTINVGALQGAGTITNSGGGTASAGTISFGRSTNTGTTVFSGVLQDGAGILNVTVDGTTARTQSFLGLSTYTGVTNIANGARLTVNTLANGGFASGIGSSTNAAGNLILSGSLIYQGNNRVGSLNLGSNSAAADRLFTIANTGTGSPTLSSTVSNGNSIVWSNFGPILFADSFFDQSLTLSGTSTGDNTFNPQLTNPLSNGLRLNKTGAGQWNLGNSNNTYTGATTINEGILGLNDNGALPTGSPLLLSPTSATSAAILQLSGIFTAGLSASPTEGMGSITWAGSIASTTGGAGFAALSAPLTVAIGGMGSPTALTWGSGGFVGTFAVQNLVLSSSTALSDVDFRNAIDLGAAQRTVNVLDNTTTGADFATISGVISGGGLSKIGAGILRLTGANIYAGVTDVQAGVVVVSSLGNSGDAVNTATSVGVSGVPFTNANAIILGDGGTTGGILQYVGAGETSDRKIRFNLATGSPQIHADGSGPLILTNVANDLATPTGAKTLFLRGTNTQGNMITSVLANDGGGGVLSITVDGAATWILTNDSNRYTGNTTVSGGALGLGGNTVTGAGTLINSNGSIFAYGADRAITNALRINSSSWLGDYSLTFNGVNDLAAGFTHNSIVAGKALTFNGLTANSLTANRTWTVDGPGETIINGEFSTATSFGVAIIKNGDGTLKLGTNAVPAVGAAWNQAGAGIDVDRGVLRFTANETINSSAGTFGGITLSPEWDTADTATLNLNGTSQTITSLTATSDGTVKIINTAVGAASLTFGGGNTIGNFGAGVGSYSIDNTGGGALSFYKTGTDMTSSISPGVTLTYTGTTGVTGGRLTIASPLNGSSALSVVNAGSSLVLSGGITNRSAMTSVVVEGGASLSLMDGAGNELDELTNLTLGSIGGTITDLFFNVGDSLAAGDQVNTDRFKLRTDGTLNLFSGNQVRFNVTDTGLSENSQYVLIDASLSGGGLFGGASPMALSDWLLNAPGGFSSMDLTTNSTTNQIILTTGSLITESTYWTEGGAADDWTELGNWAKNSSGLTPATSTPGPGSDVKFIADSLTGGAAITTALQGNFKVKSLTFEASTSFLNTPVSVAINAGTLSTNTLEVTSGGVAIDAGGSPSVTIAAPFRIGTNQDWTVTDSTSTLTFSGGLLGAADVTKKGTGKVVLSSAADAALFNPGLTVDLNVNAGNVEVTNTGALGTTANGNAATVNLVGGAFYTNTAAAATMSTPLNFNGGTLSVATNAATYTGTVAVTSTAGSFINMRDANSSVTSTTARSITFSGAVSGAGLLNVDSIDTIGTGNQISNSVTMNNGGSTWNGALGLTRGSVVFTNAANGGNATPYFGFNGAINFNQFGRILYRNIDGGTLNRTSPINFAPSAIGELLVDNLGTLTSNFTITQSGLVSLNGGSTARFLLADSASNLVFSGGVNLNGNASFTVHGGDSDSLLTIMGMGFTGTGDLAINESGTWGGISTRLAINAASSFIGNTTLNEGTLILGHKNALSSGTLTITGVSTIEANTDLVGASNVANPITLNANLTVSGIKSLELGGVLTANGNNASRTFTNNLASGSALTISGAINLGDTTGTIAGTLTIAGSGATIIAGGIADGNGFANGLTKSGEGALTLSGSSTYTGVTTVSSGALFLDNGSIGSTGTVSVASAASFGGIGSVAGPMELAAGTGYQAGGQALLNVGGGIRSGLNELNIGGDLTVGEYSIIDFYLSQTGFTQLNVAGALNLGATTRIRVNLDSGYIPGAGSAFDLLNWGSLSIGGTLNLVDLLFPLPTVLGEPAWVTDDFNLSGVLRVPRLAQSITFASIPDKLTTDSVPLSATGGGSGNSVTFAVTSGPGVITNNVLTFTTSGSVTITASQAGNDNYLAAPDVPRTFAVTKTPAAVTLGSLAQVFDTMPRAATGTTVPAGLTVEFTYDGSSMPPTNEGSFEVVGTINDLIYQGSATGTLVISKAEQVISFAAIPDKLTTDSVNLTATGGNSGNSVTFAVTSGPGVITNNVLTFTTSGSVTITASQAGNDNYLAAVDVPRTFSVTKATATVTLGSLAQVFDTTPRAATATTDPTGLTVEFTYDGSSTPPTNAGSYEVVGTINDLIYQGSATGTLVIGKAEQVISFASIPDKLTTDSVPLTATGGGSGNSVAFAVTSGPGVITNNVLTFTTSGSVTITASQAGNDNYLAAVDVPRTFAVSKAPATVTLGSLAQVFDTTPKSASATTDPLGLTVEFTYDGPNTPPTNADSYEVVGTINDLIYQGSATGTLVISKAEQVIDFATITDKLTTDSVNLTATGGNSGNSVTFAVTSGPGVITNNVLTFTTSGSVTITASQAGNDNYLAAPDLPRTFAVTKAPASVTLGSLAQVFDTTPKSATATTDPTGLTVEFTYDGSSTPPTNADSYAVVGTINDLIYQGSATGTLVIGKAEQSISFAVIPDKLTTDSVNLTATGGGSGKSVTFAVTSGPGVIANNILTFTTSGSVTITASQAGNDNYLAAPDVPRTFEVTKAPASVTLGSLAQVFNTTPRAATATTDPTGLTVEFTYAGLATAPTNANSYEVVGTINDLIYQGSATGTLVIGKAEQVITFASIPDKLTTDSVPLSATGGGSGNAVTFAVTSGPGVITNNVLTFTTSGSVTITASQAGNDNYLAAPDVPRTFAVTKASASVTLGSLAQVFNTTPRAVTATTDPAGLIVEFTYDGSNTAPTNADSYEVVGTINDLIYQGSATGTLVIGQAEQVIDFAAITDKLTTDSVPLSATGGGSGNSVTFAVTSGPGVITNNVLTFTTSGSVTVTSSQAGNDNYLAAVDLPRTFSVTKATATVTLGSLAQVFNTTPRAATATTAPAGLTVEFTYDGSNTPPTNADSYAVVGTINDLIYQGSATGTLVIDKAEQVIDFASITDKLTTDSVPLSATGGDSGNAVTFAVTSGPGVINNNVLTFTTAGSVTITASQAGNGNYLAAPDMPRTFTVSKTPATVTLGSLAQIFDTTPKLASAITDPLGLTVEFTYGGSNTAPTNANSYAVVGTINDLIYQGSAMGTLVIGKAEQVIAFASITDKLTTDSVPLAATGGGSGNSVTFAVTSGPGVITNNVLTFTTSGSVTITASQVGNGNYLAAADVPRTFAVTKAPASVTLGSLVQVFDTTPKSATATTDPFGLAVEFTYDGSNTAPTNAKSYEVVGTINDLIYQGSATGTLVIGKAEQVIDFAAITDKLTTDSVNLTATGGGSGNSVTFAVTSGPGVITNNVLTFTTAGSVTITASQAGNGNYLAAPDVPRTFTVSKTPAIITLGSLAQVFDTAPKSATATTDPTGLTVEFTYGGSNTAPTNANSYAVVGTINDLIYQGSATGTLVISKAEQVIAFAAIPDKLTTDSVPLAATGGGSGNSVTFAVTSGPGVVTNNVLTFTTSGSVTITASQAGNGNYLAAADVPRTFTVTKATSSIQFSDLVHIEDGSPRGVRFSTTPAELAYSILYSGAAIAPSLSGAYAVTASLTNSTYTGSGDAPLTILGLSGRGQRVLSGSSAPQEVNGSDLGRVILGQVTTQSFVLSNPGSQPVTLTGSPLVELLGEHATDFQVSVPPNPVIPAGGSVSFEIRFAPTQPGLRQAAVRLVCAELANGPINFAIQGFGALSSLMAQSISFSTPASVYLSQGPLALTGIASSGLPVSFTLIAGPAALQGNLLTLTGPGTVKVEARQPGGGNYASAKSVQRTITVRADPTALTLANLSQVYDGTPRPITVLGVEDATVSYRYPDGLNRAQPPAAAGSYPVSAFAAGILRKGTLVITRAPLIVQTKDQSKHLGEPNPELEVTFSGFVGGETQASVLLRSITVTTTAKDSSPPGIYPITSGGGSAANYTLIHRPGKLVVEGYVGSFEALLRDPNTTLPAGLVKVTVPAASRSASAKLALGVEPSVLSLAGPLALDAETRVASGQYSRVVRSTDTYTLNLTVNVFGELNCEVRRNGALIATAIDGIRLRDKIKGETVPQAGAYTGEMELGQSAGPNDPFAPGWTTAKVDAGGTIALTGRLGDGTAFTASLAADLRGGYRFFGQPYKPARAGAYVGGIWALEPHPTTPGRWKLDGAQLTWVKAARDLDISYRAGFGPLTLGLSMSPWQPPSKTVTLTQLLGVGQLTVEYAPTGSVSEAPLPNLVALNSNNTLQVLAPVTSPVNIRRWTAKVAPTTGAFIGSFELLDASQKRTVNFSGVLRQDRDVVQGQQGRGLYVLPPLKGAVIQENRTGDIRFLRVPE